ncbi:GNAT family N-acetyltransferase [archaeon]|jgi:GNAT superfamily N-acetyltransferase|nr:GNAT family N-acetyltransferase [archaeon]MBT6868926.1 GNAT family N-acetyltransferase [archaeon]MBT7192853.1 GNAT family N-acetyltransferase [archaeon]MBT7380819.1 GNAT family N-acetyltransferase [archaeon]MBT7507574.1 GNAT family N-acetyltransferase [archaeon]
MQLHEKRIFGKGIKIFIEEDKIQIARVFLYILHNELHEVPFGLMEDVFVIESYRSKGIGSKIVNKVIEVAKREGCYKLICTSRYGKGPVHNMYQKLGFKDHGREFRINFSEEVIN